MDRKKALLEKGYFPSQLPPCFTTEDLAKNHLSIYTDWLLIQKNKQKNGAQIQKAPESKSETFSVARVGHKRRIASIPNPVAQTYLVVAIAENWGKFLSHFRKSKLSFSKPRFLQSGERGACIPSMQHLYAKKIAKSAGYRFMLKTDLSRFFPTIYTHSIPWAIHGKAVSKKNRSPSQKYFGNIIDLALRQCQDGQTIGIPIGPDTSHIVAEAIATSVDLDLKKKLKAWPAGFRYVDDYYLFFRTVDQAESALSSLARALSDYELQINAEKTDICPVIEITDDYWTHRIRNFKISSGKKQFLDISHFFELSKDLARKNSDESVMVYALKRASSTIVNKRNWGIFESHVCHVAMAWPNTLQTSARIFSTYKRLGYPIDKPRIKRLINSLLEIHGPLNHHSEIAWCLWLCKELEINVSGANVDLISETHSSIFALILLDLSMRGLLEKQPKTGYWKQFETEESLHGDLWMLSYEAGARGWGGFGDTHIRSDKYFNALLSRDVHFYDANAITPSLFHVKKSALTLYKVDNEIDFFDLEDAVHDDNIEFEDYDGGYEGVIVSDENDDEDEDVFHDPDDEFEDPPVCEKT
jgi:hypothetical protein